MKALPTSSGRSPSIQQRAVTESSGIHLRVLRQFPTALKLYDRALDLLPNDPDFSAWKARMYQAEGNLQEAAKLLVAVNAQTPSGGPWQSRSPN